MSGSTLIKWLTPEILVTVATSLQDDTPLEINFASTIGYKKHVTKTMKPVDAYWLPSSYNQNTPEYRATVLAPPFVQACQRAGFVVMMKEHDMLPGNRSKVMFVCHRFRFHKPRRKPDASKAATRLTQRAIKGQEETCGFKFNVYWDNNRHRWFLPKQQAGSIEHRGHVPLPPDQVKISYRTTSTTTAQSTTTQPPNGAKRKTKVDNQVDNYYNARERNTSTTRTDCGAKRSRDKDDGSADQIENKAVAVAGEAIMPDEDDASEDGKSVNAYEKLLPLFQDIAGCIHTDEAAKECQRMMLDIHQKLKSMPPSTETTNTTPTPLRNSKSLDYPPSFWAPPP